MQSRGGCPLLTGEALGGMNLFDAARAAGVRFSAEVLPSDHHAVANGMRLHYLDWGNAHLPPMLLLGEPGIGKTHFARRLAHLLGTGFGFVPMSSLTAGWVLSGASSQWKNAKPGKVFDTWTGAVSCTK